jgi:hypothetical protein
MSSSLHKLPLRGKCSPQLVRCRGRERGSGRGLKLCQFWVQLMSIVVGVGGEFLACHENQRVASLAGWGAGALFWAAMKGLLLLLIHLVAGLARLLGPGGVRGLVAENLLIKQQLLILSRARQRAPNLSPVERRPGYPCHPSGHGVGMTGRLRGQLVIMMEPTEERERDDLATNTRNQT